VGAVTHNEETRHISSRSFPVGEGPTDLLCLPLSPLLLDLARPHFAAAASLTVLNGKASLTDQKKILSKMF